MIINQNALKLGTNTGNILNINYKKEFFQIFFFRWSGGEKIGKKSEFFAIFCISFTKKSIKQINVSMKVENIVEHRFFFKKHKFKKHEAQNAEILRNIYKTLPG